MKPTGCKLQNASAMTPDGSAIVGRGTKQEAFRAVPIAP
jgi:hypothetical protein